MSRLEPPGSQKSILLLPRLHFQLFERYERGLLQKPQIFQFMCISFERLTRAEGEERDFFEKAETFIKSH